MFPDAQYHGVSQVEKAGLPLRTVSICDSKTDHVWEAHVAARDTGLQISEDGLFEGAKVEEGA